MNEKYAAVIAVTDAFCRARLNEEYGDMARRMAAALARKRPSPLAGGRINTWACGIVYALGQVNFLFDKSQTPHMRADELCAGFGLAPNTGNTAAKKVRTALKVDLYDPQWTLPSLVDSHPTLWLILVDGFLRDARSLPREIQEVAYQKGLIPYIHADRSPGGIGSQ
jgi:hypothetical protein